MGQTHLVVDWQSGFVDAQAFWATTCAGFGMRGWLSGLGGEERIVATKGYQS